MRYISVLLAIILSLAIIGCSTAEDGKSDSSESGSASESTAATETESATEAETESEKETEAVKNNENLTEKERDGYVQPQFFISAFKALPHSTSATLDTFQKIVKLNKEAGINLIENAIMSRAEGLQAFRACEAEGVRFLAQNITSERGFSGMGTQAPKVTEVIAKSVVKEMKDYEFFEGYFTWDEPDRANLEKCRDINALFKKHDPDTLTYSLMLPSYGAYTWKSPDGTLENSDYAKYVDEYIKTVDPDVLSFDYYPISAASTRLMDSDLWRDMGLIRKKSLETGMPFWFYFQAYNMDKGFTFTGEMISTQMYCALAYGVKSLSYYGSMTSLVSGTGEKQPLYEEAKEINRRVQNIGDLLFNATSRELYHFGIRAVNRENFYLDDVENSSLIKSAPRGTIVGVFEEGEKQYIIVASKDFKKAITGTLELKKEVVLSSFDAQNATVSTIGNVSHAELNLPAGGCAVFVIG